MGTLLFVYGTLKAGFLNHGTNRGTRVPGVYRTRQAYPLLLVTRRSLPWLVNEPGQGERVVGELYDVDAVSLAAMDELERVHIPGWYQRVAIAVDRIDGPATDDAAPGAPGAHAAHGMPLACQVYLGGWERAREAGIRLGPLSEYTLAHQQRFLDSGSITLDDL